MEIIWIGVLTLLSSIIGTVSGFGISTIMVPVILIFLPLPETLLLVGLIHWFGDIWKMLLFKHGFDKKLLIYFGVPGVLMAILGGLIVVDIPEKLASQLVGLILTSYVIFAALKPKFKLKEKPSTAILGGMSSGFLGGVTGVGGGALRAAILTAFNIPKSTYIFTSGILGALMDAGRISAYIFSGVKIQSSHLWGFLLFIPASFLGAEIAKKMVYKISQKTFKKIIGIFLLLLGLKLLVFP